MSSIASLLATERNNQAALATAAGKTETEISNNYYFNVFKDLYRFPDVSHLPMVNVYNARGDFDSAQSTTASKRHSYNLAIDCYVASTAEVDPSDANVSIRADKLTAARLDYLWAQVWGTLMAEQNWHKGLRDLVRVARFTEWEQKRVSMGGEDDGAECVLGIQSILELQFDEKVEIITGEPLEQIVIDLEIDDQFISPFVTANIS
jgi:hypothetical protein